jgi:hypothetical protein
MGAMGISAREAIRHKNAMFHALTEARLKCERRRHTHGEIPPTWAARLAELQRQYDEACEWCRLAFEVRRECVSGTPSGAPNACKTVPGRH